MRDSRYGTRKISFSFAADFLTRVVREDITISIASGQSASFSNQTAGRRSIQNGGCPAFAGWELQVGCGEICQTFWGHRCNGFIKNAVKEGRPEELPSARGCVEKHWWSLKLLRAAQYFGELDHSKWLLQVNGGRADTTGIGEDLVGIARHEDHLHGGKVLE